MTVWYADGTEVMLINGGIVPNALAPGEKYSLGRQFDTTGQPVPIVP